MAPSGLRECVNGLFWLRECVKMGKKSRECVNWKNLREREKRLFDCVNCVNLPCFLREHVNFPFHPNLCKFPRFFNISPTFSKDFPENRVCVNAWIEKIFCVNAWILGPLGASIIQSFLARPQINADPLHPPYYASNEKITPIGPA